MAIRTITVKGVGRATAKPDLAVLSMQLETKDMQYEEAIRLASLRIENLVETLTTIGYDREALKTTDFNASTCYRSEKDKNGNYQKIFDGYKIQQLLKLGFDFDQKRLAVTVEAVSKCISKPEFDIKFTVKDNAAINKDMLVSASVNARTNAEILCEASGAKLGDLMSIDYNWGKLKIYSKTQLKVPAFLAEAPQSRLEIQPDDIDLSDTVTFVWEIEEASRK